MPLHSKDLSEKSEESLHPNVPFRSGELLIKQDKLKTGLHLYMHKGLIQLNLTDGGFKYSASDSSRYFLDLLSNQYTINLEKKAKWLSIAITKITDKELKKIINKNLTEWNFDTFIENDFIKDSNNE